MEENNQNQSQPNQVTPPPVQPTVEQNAPVPPPLSKKPKLKLLISIAVVLFFLFAIGSALAAYFFVPRCPNPPTQKDIFGDVRSQNSICITWGDTTKTAKRNGTSQNLRPQVSHTPTPDSTANWKTYTNGQYGFSIKYPETWEEKPGPYLDGFYAPPSSECLPPHACGGSTMGFNIDVRDNLYKSIQEHINKFPDMYSLTHFVPYNSFGNKGWMIDRNGLGAGANQQILIPIETSIISVTCSLCDDKLTDQILSTFKIINKVSNIQQGEGFSFVLPYGFSVHQKSPSETSFIGKGYTNPTIFLKNQSTPFIKPVVSATPEKAGEISGVEKSTITVGGKNIEKYIVSCNAADCYYAKVYFNVNGRYYEFQMDIAGGGLILRLDDIIHSLKFTN